MITNKTVKPVMNKMTKPTMTKTVVATKPIKPRNSVNVGEMLSKIKPMAKPMMKAPKKVTVAKVSAPKKAMPTQAKGKAYGVMGTKPVKPMK